MSEEHSWAEDTVALGRREEGPQPPPAPQRPRRRARPGGGRGRALAIGVGCAVAMVMLVSAIGGDGGRSASEPTSQLRIGAGEREGTPVGPPTKTPKPRRKAGPLKVGPAQPAQKPPRSNKTPAAPLAAPVAEPEPSPEYEPTPEPVPEAPAAPPSPPSETPPSVEFGM